MATPKWLKLKIYYEHHILFIRVPILSEETKSVHHSDLPPSVQSALADIKNPYNYVETYDAFQKHVNMESYVQLVELLKK
jgi:hypothetical protein